MADTTGVEWADATFNSWWGCAEVSPGCAHCYARTWATWTRGKDLWPPKGQPNAEHAFAFSSEANWRKPLKWARTLPEQLGRRPRVFTASMSDVFEEHPALDEHRTRLFDLICDTPELDWLVLTKRPEFARDWLAARLFGGKPMLPPNVWMGVSIENARYTWRADVLREIPAAVRFISAEPLLGSLFEQNGVQDADRVDRADEGRVAVAPVGDRQSPRAVAGGRARRGAPRAEGLVVAPGAPRGRAPLDLTGIDWVIAGGESGPRARPSHPDWFRELRDACIDAGVGVRLLNRPAFFFKQWGEWAPSSTGDATRDSISQRIVEGPKPRFRILEGGEYVYRVGKKTAGRELDGRVWDEFPQSAAVPA